MRRTFFLLAIAPLLAQDDAIRGDYVEDRSNHVHGCYCEWSGQSQTGGREAMLAWRVRSGAYSGVALAGTIFTLVVLGDANLSFGWAAQFAPPPRQSVLVIDQAASPAQRRAVEALIRERFPVMAGRILAVRQAPIEFSISPEGAAVTSPRLFEMRMRKARLPEDNLPGATKWYDAFLPTADVQLGTTLINRWSGREFQLTWVREEPTTSGYYGSFVFFARPQTMDGLSQHPVQPMLDPVRPAAIGETPGQPLQQTDAALGLPQQQTPPPVVSVPASTVSVTRRKKLASNSKLSWVHTVIAKAVLCRVKTESGNSALRQKAAFC